jgi:aminoglycoside 6'-N-acetyltransferase
VADLGYVFRAMSTADLALVLHWLKQPHVVQWWGDPHQQFELVSGDLDAAAMDQFIVATNDRPFAYIQCYDPTVWPDNGLGVHPSGTRGVDQFIGEPDMINRGHGSAFIRYFIARVLTSGAPRVICDPHPQNHRAVRAYEKAGFARARIVDTPDGLSLLMVRNRSALSCAQSLLS